MLQNTTICQFVINLKVYIVKILIMVARYSG